MSFLFGGGRKAKPEFQGVQVQTSSNASPLPLVWGLTRLAPNLIWYGDFKATPVKPAGKGGGGKGGTQYDYTASVEMALCQGPSAGVLRVFVDKLKTGTLASQHLTFINGSDPQAPWSYLTSNHPDQALSYPGTVILAKTKMDLGTSASLPQHAFETKALQYNTQVDGLGDADPALVVNDLLTLPTGGCGFPSSLIDTTSLMSGPNATTTGDSAFQTYCRALGLGISPALVSQEPASSVLDRWGKILNTAMVWTGSMFKFIPFGLEPVTGHGVTYIPLDTSINPIYSLTDKDYISSGDDPVIVSRRDTTTIKNRLHMEILHREKEYNPVPVEWIDQGLIDQYGERQDSVFQAHEVCELGMATTMVSLMGQHNAYTGNNKYKFTLGPEYCLVEPMDCLELIDPMLGVVSVQVDRTEEDEDNNIAFEASQVLIGSSASTGFTPPDQTPTGTDSGMDPGVVNTPIFIEPTSLLAGSSAQVWAAVSGTIPNNWGGCFVWASNDNTTFTQIGEITSPARMGVTTSALAAFAGTNPDTVNTLGVDLSESAGALIGVSAGDAAKFTSLCYAGGEFLSYQDALLTSTSHYTLQTALYRGLYGTTPGAHASGVPFARIDDTIFKYTLPTNYIGQTIYFKFQSYNIFGQMVQDISTCTVYTFTPSGTGYGTGTNTTTGQSGVPQPVGTPSASATLGYNLVTWTLGLTQDNIKQYLVYRANGTGAAFSSATQIGTTTGNNYTDSTATAGTAYTYFIVAQNAVGNANPSTGVSITSAAAATVPFGFAFQRDIANIVLSQPFAMFDTPGAISWTLPSGMTNCKGAIGGNAPVAPSAQTDFDVQSPAGTSIGTMRFAAGSLTATFIKAANTVIAAGQVVQLVAPASLNSMAGTIYASIVGTK